MSIPIASPIYTLGSWEGNVTDDHGVDWIVEAEDGWSSSPPVRATRTERPTADGAFGGPGFYGSRVINLQGRAVASARASMLAAKDRIKAAIGPRSLVALRVDEAHMARTAMVRLSDTIDLSDKGARSFAWSLTVVADDPRRYDVNSSTASTFLPSTDATGRTYPRTYNYSYPTTGVQYGSVFFHNRGDYDQCPGVITVWGPVIDPFIAHVQTGRLLAFDIDLDEGQYLEIDLLTRTAKLNGTASRAGAITQGSSWFMFVPGVNEIQFRGEVGPSSGGSEPVMQVTAASAWT